MNKLLFQFFVPFFFIVSLATYSTIKKYSKEKIIVTDNNFLMPVEDVFSITGRGTVVTGKISRGTIKVGDSVELVGLSHEVIKSKIKSVEVFGKMIDQAKKEDNIGLLLSGIERTQVNRGMVVCKPGSIRAYAEFSCKIELLSKSEGGRSTPIYNKYRPQFYFYNTGISAVINLPEGKESLQPGENAIVSVELIMPVALENDMSFVIKEGGRTVGQGKVIRLIQ